VKSGAADNPTAGSPANNESGGGGSGSGSGMSPGGAAVLALFIIGIVGLAVGSFFFVKLGYGHIDSKFPFYHRFTATHPDPNSRKNANYVAFTE